ncbi:SH3-like domain-containing protein [Agrobacterium rosae]|uniref:Low-molecular weight cobalt-containing nitrile hydratase subunit beta n=1 Tax=Agrobacterium rosae TaxID=1972867 RepID=A0A1R3U3B6_9HYPH|nr:SH3-like domain-containing protein [Agrobacterium rosae]SCX36096.1 Low-molecular weight cobalt-containing nitrile hydratase subunit beta [Agrobacterium rosae]
MPTMFPAENVDTLVRTGGSCRVDVAVEPGFTPGEQVTIVNINPATHTRLPRYVRGKTGKIHADHGVFVFPDTNVQLKGEKPQHVYSVAFDARELWGEAASPKDKFYVDMFEDYLVPKK